MLFGYREEEPAVGIAYGSYGAVFNVDTGVVYGLKGSKIDYLSGKFRLRLHSVNS